MKTLKKRLGRLLKLQFDQHSTENISKNKAALAKVRPPRDDIDRAYIHYGFLKRNYPKLQWYLTCAYSFLLLLPRYVKYTVGAGKAQPGAQRGGLVVISDKVSDFSDLLPEELSAEYGGVQAYYSFASDAGVRRLGRDEKRILRACFRRHPFSFKFLLHIMDALALYAGVINKERPDAIATFASEDSCRVAVLTQYCEQKGVRHIDFMHGERFHGYTQAYMRFNDIYVWNARYRELYEEAGIQADRWHVYTPGKYTPVIREKEIAESKIVKCYLCGETNEVLSRMKEAFDSLTAQGYCCVIRWHPRFSNVQEVKSCFRGYALEDPARTGIADSLRGAGYALSGYSTVLLQARSSGIPIIVDDYSDTVRTEMLEQIGYWGLRECYARLSELMRSGNGETV